MLIQLPVADYTILLNTEYIKYIKPDTPTTCIIVLDGKHRIMVDMPYNDLMVVLCEKEEQ